MVEIGKVLPVKIEEEMKDSYLDYAMSVIVSRALPDARDGLKPVHRRILYAMSELNMGPTSPYKKSARIVGEVLGKFHPHGDAPVYEAMVRMAQDFSLRYMLVDGQGNFGSIDDDPPAAMRYTEARLSAIATEMLTDLDKDTVAFIPNFDNTLKEPVVLPARIPQLLMNGTTGIAVGLATSIPPHNLGELCHALAYLVENPAATSEELLPLVPGPDFPTAGIIRGKEGILKAYATGVGRITLEGRCTIEEAAKGKSQIIVTELPYQTNKAALVERIAELVRDKKLEGIAELRDESDREGIRLVIELKREVQPQLVLNNLLRRTDLRSAFFVNMVALVEGQPRTLSLKAVLLHFLNFRREVILRRSRYELEKTQERAHVLEGLKTALDHLDEVIATIRSSPSAEAAREALMRDFSLTQLQAQAILDMQLRRLAGLEREKILEEYAEALKTIAYLEDLLASPRKMDFIILEDLKELREKYGDPRRTEISEEEVKPLTEIDLIPHQQVVVTLSQRGYVKQMPLDRYRLQQRGGRGVTGMGTREEDAVQHLITADTHDSLLFFSNRGRVFSLKCYEIRSDTSRTARGIPFINLAPLDPKEQVTAMVALNRASDYLLFATRQGAVKKTPLGEFASIRSSGLIAMDLKESDELVAVRPARKDDEVILATQKGMAIRFPLSGVPSRQRYSGGVRGIRLDRGDRVVGMDLVIPGAFLLTVTEQGSGKLTPLKNYPRHHRGGHGVRTFRLSPQTGDLVGAHVIDAAREIMLISAEGIIIRLPTASIASQSRITQGVSLMRLDQGDRVASVACCLEQEDREGPPV